ncbi:MAG TPA: BTAD domain-containing putative transcriptional regulator, partial [Chloroflexota bacterium]|nr:BTAD domain-containing putative transcriptional regulator [Chloroflexota bacterium]
RPVEADAQADAAVQMARRLGMDTLLNGALRARVWAALTRRDRAGARALIEEARPLAVIPLDLALLDLLDGTAALRARAIDRACVALARAEEGLLAVNHRHQAARACLLLAEALLAGGERGKAVAAIHRLTDLIASLTSEGFLWPMGRFARQVLGERGLLRRLRRDSRRLLDRMAGTVPSLALALPTARDEGAEPALRLSPFGQGRIVLHGRLLDHDALPTKAREVLFLAGRARGSVSRTILLEAVWDDAPSAARDLWDASRHLRRVLGEDAWGVRGGVYRVALPLIDEGGLFGRAGMEAQASGSILERLAAGERALALFGAGGYLEGCGSAWAEDERVLTNGLAVRTALVLAGLYQKLARPADAEIACRRAMAWEPLEEAPRITLMRHLAEQGHLGAALREYQAYQELVRTELGMAPSVELRRLMTSLSGR